MPRYSGVWTSPAQMQAQGASNWPSQPLPPYALFVSGRLDSSVAQNTIDYVNITTTGNATSWGTLNYAGDAYQGACASSTTAVFAAGALGNYWTSLTFATQGNTTNFAAAGNSYGPQGCNSSTRGVFGGNETPTSVMYYLTIATTGTISSFGNLAFNRSWSASCSSSTRGLFAGGASTDTSAIEYITIATTGNATTFGNLTSVSPNHAAGCSTSTTGLFMGLTTGFSNTIDQVTIATTGNATSFGQLTSARNQSSAASSTTRGVFGGGKTSVTTVNTIDYVTVASAGNATSFGQLTSARYVLTGVGNYNGGVQ